MNKYAVITGASSGIGKEFAVILANQGYKLVLVARRFKRLKQLADNLNVECLIVEADLQKQEDCLALMEKIKDLDVEIFINNAGFGLSGNFSDIDLNDELMMIDLNVKALHLLTKLMLAKMEKNKHGYILNVGSVAGLMPAGPHMATYYASKSYVTSLTQGIARELKEQHSQVHLSCLCPGPVDTEFNDVAKVKFALKGIDANYCACYALKKMKQGKVVIIPTVKMKVAMTLGRYLPNALYIKIASFQQKKKQE